MTGKIYKTARGKSIDLGALMLENEHVRAVGNMNVNARGDLLDGTNRVIDPKRKQVQRQYAKQSNVAAQEVVTSTRQAKARARAKDQPVETSDVEIDQDDVSETLESENESPAPADSFTRESIPRGGLAAAIARSREVKQNLEKTPRQQQQSKPGVKKI